MLEVMTERIFRIQTSLSQVSTPLYSRCFIGIKYSARKWVLCCGNSDHSYSRTKTLPVIFLKWLQKYLLLYSQVGLEPMDKRLLSESLFMLSQTFLSFLILQFADIRSKMCKILIRCWGSLVKGWFNHTDLPRKNYLLVSGLKEFIRFYLW